MKKLVITLLATLALACVVALPATATKPGPIGPKIQPLSGSPQTFPGGTAFHLENCWNVSSDVAAIGKYSISLDVDGTPRAVDFTALGTNPDDPSKTQRCFGWNFPAGMSSNTTHTFTEHWFAPCYAFSNTFTCANPNEVVEAFTLSLTVNFT
jgi:hypothetical protein